MKLESLDIILTILTVLGTEVESLNIMVTT